MATSGTHTFNLPVDDLLRKAYNRIGVHSPTGYDMREARLSLNLLLHDIASRSVFMFATEPAFFFTTAGQKSYVLSVDTTDIQDVTCETNGIDIAMTSWSQSDYARMPNKSHSGRPVNYFTDRGRDQSLVYLWPVPDRQYKINYYKIKKPEDVNAYTETVDLPVKYLPAIVSGLAWTLSDEKFAAAPAEMNAAMRETERMRRDQLKQRFEEELNRVIDEDRERASIFIRPDFRRR